MVIQGVIICILFVSLFVFCFVFNVTNIFIQGVNSDKCDQCLPEYKDFGVTGCQGCDCDEDGSTGFLCDDESGQCPCKVCKVGFD